MKTFELLETCYVTLSISPDKREEILKLLKENDIDCITIWDNYKNWSKIYARLTLDTKEKIKSIINTWLDIIDYHQKTFWKPYDRENFWII